MQARFTDEQIVTMIGKQEADERNAVVYRRNGLGSAAFYKCKPKYGGTKPSDGNRLRDLADGTGKVKKLLAFEDSVLGTLIRELCCSKVNSRQRRRTTATTGGSRKDFYVKGPDIAVFIASTVLD